MIYREDINNGFRKRIQEAQNIEEELLVWEEIKSSLSVSDKGKGIKNVYYDTIRYPYINTEERNKGLLPFKNITESEWDSINSVSEEKQYEIVCRCPYIIRWLKNPSDRIQIKVCMYDGSLIKDIKNQCMEAKYVASRNVYNIRFIQNPTLEMYEFAYSNLFGEIKCQDGTIPESTELYSLIRGMKLIPRHINREKETVNYMVKSTEDYIEKHILPMVEKEGKNIQKAYKSRNETAIMISEYMAFFKFIKFMKKSVILIPLKIIMFAPKMIWKMVNYLFHSFYVEVICGIDENIINIFTTTHDYYGCYYTETLEKINR